MLCVIFDKYGISNENIIMAIENLDITLSIWNDFNLNLIERNTLIKTFAISESQLSFSYLYFIYPKLSVIFQNIKDSDSVGSDSLLRKPDLTT